MSFLPAQVQAFFAPASWLTRVLLCRILAVSSSAVKVVLVLFSIFHFAPTQHCSWGKEQELLKSDQICVQTAL